MFAAGFGLGLFFGWLLHRERVERALYEDVVRARDRATAALAETSARLELANKDMIRLRGQLSDAQYQLRERDAAIAELESSVLTTTDGPIDLDLFDEDEDEADITEEVPLAAVATRPAGADDQGDASGDGTGSDDQAVSEAEVIEEEVTLQEPPVGEKVEEAAVEESVAEVPVVEESVADEPVVEESVAEEIAVDAGVVEGDAVPEAEVIEDEVSLEEPQAGEDAERVAAEGPVAEEPVVQAEEAEVANAAVDGEAAGEEPVVEPVGVAPRGDEPVNAVAPDEAVADDLQRITGVGPKVEQRLRAEGITTFRDLALLDDAAIADLAARDPRLAGRLRKGGWVAQARRLHVESHGSHP